MRARTTTIEVTPEERFGYMDLTEGLQRAIKDSGVTEGPPSPSAPTRRARF